MAGLLAAQGDQRHVVAAEEPKKSRKRPSDGDDNPDEDEQEKLGKGSSYKCRFCDQCFQKSQALGGHMNKHRQEREEETLHKAQALISDKQHQHMTTQGYMNMYGQLSATEIAQRSSALSGMQARGPQSYGMPATTAYYHSTATGLAHANTSFLTTQHLNPMMPTNSSTNHVQQNLTINPMMSTNSNNHVQHNPGNAQPWNIDNNTNLAPQATSIVPNEPSYHHHEMIQILHDSSSSTPPIHESYHSSI